MMTYSLQHPLTIILKVYLDFRACFFCDFTIDSEFQKLLLVCFQTFSLNLTDIPDISISSLVKLEIFQM